MAVKTNSIRIKELKAFIKLMRANHVLKLKVNGIELELAHAAFDPIAEVKVNPIVQEFGEVEPKVEPWKQYSDEELATWSSADPSASIPEVEE